ncbi:hypothetical protein B0I35DRAFT_425392 [Stachybotrys elegans]|uniref:Uncharacterized protein n=1 Tax=Stachybotrys elegans TaxID=80388 RepID=A0A8K0SY80_9HYPO|nr:hypothetical protein B0I35DRAFT_425392 [Stachybotrys elegans]
MKNNLNRMAEIFFLRIIASLGLSTVVAEQINAMNAERGASFHLGSEPCWWTHVFHLSFSLPTILFQSVLIAERGKADGPEAIQTDKVTAATPTPAGARA